MSSLASEFNNQNFTKMWSTFSCHFCDSFNPYLFPIWYLPPNVCVWSAPEIFVEACKPILLTFTCNHVVQIIRVLWVPIPRFWLYFTHTHTHSFSSWAVHQVWAKQGINITYKYCNFQSNLLLRLSHDSHRKAKGTTNFLENISHDIMSSIAEGVRKVE